jgi:serine/threonine protein kinase
VFLAWDPLLRREVALKVPHLEVLFTPELRQRFLHEAQAAAGLDHPHIVPVLEVGEIGAACYIASTYCAGVNLAGWLKEQTVPVPIYDAATLIATLADAVHYVHGHKVWHRDIKPSNILLQSASSSDGAARAIGLAAYIPRLTDFGLAKIAGAETQVTRTGTALGTPAYMAPEQAEGRLGEIGPHTDVYALGAVLYEVLTGRPPFHGATPLDTLRQVVAKEPPPVKQLRENVPRDLETICLKCLHKEPKKRYASGGALTADLRRFLNGRPIHARATGYTERFGRWCRRNPALASASGLATAAVTLLVAVLIGQYFR